MVSPAKIAIVGGILIIIGLLAYFGGNSTMAQNSGGIVTQQNQQLASQGQYEVFAGGGSMIFGLLALLFALFGTSKIPPNIKS